MNGKSQNTAEHWVDPDDAPELTDAFFDNATYRIGERIVTKEEFDREVAAARRIARDAPAPT